MTAENAPLPRFQVCHVNQVNHDWNRAIWLEDFQFHWESTPPPKTKFSALWSEEWFLYYFQCWDADLVLGEGETLKERVLGSDRVELFFAPDLSLDPYYAFEISPRGEILAYRARHYRQYDWEWSCPDFQTEANIFPTSYNVRGGVPMAVLRELNILKPGATEFYAGVFRAEFSHKPDGSIHSGWMPWVNPQTERPDFHVPSAFGVFELVS